MKTINVSEAEGLVLNYLVAVCEGKHYGDIGHGQIYVCYPDGTLYCSKDHWRPSSWWAQGGPIIEREKISINPLGGDYWEAYKRPCEISERKLGPTPLVAAMRCYVASKLGDTVEVPEELL